MSPRPVAAALAALVALALAGVHLADTARADDRDDADFFEKKVRPVLAGNCYRCHGPARAKAGLRLDSPDGILAGGSSGPAVVPGNPDASILVQAIRWSDDELSMPPKEKLARDEIAAIEEWVRRGAKASAAPVTTAVHLWALDPPLDRPRPGTRTPGWARTPIDDFVLARLEAEGLRPSPPADKLTLIRRATFDLTGLPPGPAEIDAFLDDEGPDAFEKLVDRLLASPRYGERWGRHWLDVARYADTKGYVFIEERRFPFAWTYRDWVVRALNEDMPYDRFVTEQIAADRLGGDRGSLAALGFLTVGRRFLNNAPDIIDDRIDVVTRGLLGLTVSCARCHDHKYDPITAKDYYALYGVFASSVEPKELPLLDPPEEGPEHGAYLAERARLEADVADFRTKRRAEIEAEIRRKDKLAAYLLAAHDAKTPEAVNELAQERDLRPAVLARWQRLYVASSERHSLFGPWHSLGAVTSETHPLVAAAFATKAASPKEAAERYAALLAPSPDALPEALRAVLHAPGSPGTVDGPLEAFYNRADSEAEKNLRNKIDALEVTSPGAPPRAMALEDAPKPADAHVFIRGNPGNKGERVPRRFLACLGGEPFTKGSGRLELARAIASPENPLTARVAVNRIWLHHFGAGLVRTPSDLGSRSEPPSHPELLDWLARWFVREGWSQKKLHRLILLSSAWQQRSDDVPAAREKDPENRLLWRQNRRRLDWEQLRDTLLALSGELDDTVGGRPVDILAEPFARRRTLYGSIDRQNLPAVFRTFDLASPDLHSSQRHETTVPQQALYLLNAPFVLEQARGLAARVAPLADPSLRVRELHRIVFGRAARADEVDLGVGFVAAEGEKKRDPAVWQYGRGQYDEAAGRVSAFELLPHFTGSAWQGGPALPDPKLGWCVLTAQGGHPGNDQKHAVVRRWTAPRDATVTIDGKLAHRQRQGDGVRGRIVSSLEGERGSWVVHDGEAETHVAGLRVTKGSTVDFVVDCRANEAYDSFAWAPIIKDEAATWNAAADFAGPSVPLSAWEKYAHVLLLTNELDFVD